MSISASHSSASRHATRMDDGCPNDLQSRTTNPCSNSVRRSLDRHAGGPYSLDDRDATQLAICAREFMPSLLRMCRMWLSTVLSDMNNC